VYALDGGVFAAGSVVEWMRDRLQLITNALELDQLAQEAEEAPRSAGLY